MIKYTMRLSMKSTHIAETMWKLTLAYVVVLTNAGANCAIQKDDLQAEDVFHTNLGSTSIFLKALEPKDTIDADGQLLEEQIVLLNTIMGRSAVANTIRNFLESFRETVINGDDDIPPLDPLVINHIGPFVYTYTGVRLTANIRNFRMEGLRWYVVNDVTFNVLRLAVGVRMTVPWLIFSGNYDATAWIALLSHRSAGNFRIFLNRLDVDVDARIGTNIQGGHLMLRTLDIKIDVSDVQINISGMTGSPILNNLINAMVQGVTRDFINNEMENVSKLISEALFDAINDILKDFTIDDLFN